MEGDRCRAELGILRRPAVGVVDHEVHVERNGTRRLDALDHLRAEGEVRDEVVVHDVDMHEVRLAMRVSSACMFTKSAARMLGLIRTLSLPNLAGHPSIMVEPWIPSRRSCNRCSTTSGRERRSPSVVYPRARLRRTRAPRLRGRGSSRSDPLRRRRPGGVHDPVDLQAVRPRAGLSDLGLDAVMKRVGTEPSGEPFNAISLERAPGVPRIPWSTPERSRRRRWSGAPTSRSAPRVIDSSRASPGERCPSMSRCTGPSPRPATATGRWPTSCARTASSTAPVDFASRPTSASARSW